MRSIGATSIIHVLFIYTLSRVSQASDAVQSYPSAPELQDLQIFAANLFTDFTDDGDKSKFTTGLNQLNATAYTKVQWPWGKIPRPCYLTAVQDRYCSPYNIEVWEVNYADCPLTPYIFCRCTNSPLSIDALATSISKIPISTREHVSIVSSWPSPRCSSWTLDREIAILGPCTSQSLFFYEFGYLLNRHSEPSRIAGSDKWVDSMEGVSCVPDVKSRESWSEVYAKVVVLVSMLNLYPSIEIPCLGALWERVKELHWNDEKGTLRWEEGKKCTFEGARRQQIYVFEDKINCMGQRAAAQGLCPGWKPDRGLGGAGYGFSAAGFGKAEGRTDGTREELQRKRRAEEEAGVVWTHEVGNLSGGRFVAI